MVGRSLDPEPAKVDVSALARCHRRCLPNTASSHAGLQVVRALYGALLRDVAARVVWYPAVGEEEECGAFASGTVCYRETEVRTRSSLSKLDLARLALRTAAHPGHVLSRWRWEELIPRRGIGYVLTLGTTNAVLQKRGAARGSQLLSELESWFSGQGCEASYVDTELANTRAHAFYVRHGYLEVSRSFGQVLLQKPL